MIKVCFWCTSFQADNQALACYLADQPGFDVVVAMDNPEAYRREPVERLLPFHGRLLERGARSTRAELKAFAPDLLVIDNHLPNFRVARRALVVWHGFGWRVDDLSTLRKELRAHVGDVTSPNADFRWLAFGEWDRRYRARHSEIAPENLWNLGSAYADLLLPESAFQKSLSGTDWRGELGGSDGKKSVMLGLTWHHGGALQHWGDDQALTERLIGTIGELGANVLIRMHDKHRYDPKYLATLASLALRHRHVRLKFKSESPDSLVDLLSTDVLVSNYSSLLNPFYYTGRPTVHIDPSDVPGADATFRVFKRGKVRELRSKDGATTWKLPPDQIGGLRARSFEELCAQIERALREPDCCRSAAADFCQRYLERSDGTARSRIQRQIEEWSVR